MFWGLVLEPSKKYSQKVERSFHISQATLELKSASQDPVSLVLEFEGDSFVLCNLSKKQNILQVPLDLNFQVGDKISFRTIGTCRVHLSGYHIPEELDGLSDEEDDDEEDEEEFNEAEALKQLKNKIENESSPAGKRKKDLDKSNQKKKQKLDATTESKKEGNKKGVSDSTLFDLDDIESDLSDDGSDSNEELSDEEDDDFDEELSDEEDDLDDEEGGEEEEEDNDDSENEAEVGEEEEKPKVKTPKSEKKKKGEKTPNVSMNGTLSKKEKKNKSKLESATPNKSFKQNETPKKDGPTPKKTGKTPEKNPKTPNSNSPQKKVLSGGVIVEDLKSGDGPMAKPGKMVQVYYVGRLQNNNKTFDSSTTGSGFRFRLGKGEVIKGWDIGVNGMKVGGKRKIVIPAPLAYGQKGSPPVIPPNSTLVFEVELKGLS